VLESDEEIKNILLEIRDTQREQLELYRTMAERSVELQESDSRRHAAHLAFYRRVVLGAAVLVAALIAWLVFNWPI
jgi:hypothetical protein